LAVNPSFPEITRFLVENILIANQYELCQHVIRHVGTEVSLFYVVWVCLVRNDRSAAEASYGQESRSTPVREFRL